MVLIFEIHAPPELTAGTFEATVDFTVTSAEERFTLDLNLLRRAELFVLIQLLTIMNLARQNGATVQVFLPEREHVRRQQAEIGFYEMFPEGVWTNRPIPMRSGKGWEQIVPFTRLNVSEGGTEIDRLSNLVYDDLPPRSREGFIEALAELGLNVIDHSEAAVGFIAGARRGNTLELVVGDAGIGIRQSLASRAELPEMDDFQAVRYALLEDTTSKPGRNSGAGLPTVWDFTAAFGGDLRIRTGRILALLDAFERPLARAVLGLQGTIVGMTLRRGWN